MTKGAFARTSTPDSAGTRRRARKLGTERRREQLAQGALEIIGARGFSGLSVGAVAEASGIVASGVYKHFRGKQELIDAAIDRIGDQLRGNLAAVECQGQDAPESLHRLLLRHAETIRLQGIARIIFSDETYRGHPDRKRKVYGFVTEYLNGVAALVRRGQEAGQMHRDRDPTTAAVLFLGIVQPAGVLWHLSGGEFDIDGHIRNAWAAFSAWLFSDPLERPEPPVVRRRGRKDGPSQRAAREPNGVPQPNPASSEGNVP